MSDSNNRRGQLSSIWRRFKKSRVSLILLAVVAAIFFVALFADLIVPYEKALEQNITERLQGPTAAHWFGTDELGRDIFARIIHGTRESIKIAVTVSLMSMIIGTFLGSIAAFYGGRIDNIIMRLVDVMLAIPGIILVIAIVASLGTHYMNLVIALTVAYVPSFVRLVRATMLTIKGNEYVEACTAMGGRTHHIIIQHLLLNAMSPIIVSTTMSLSGIILAASALGFIGLGAQPPTPEWGSMLAGGRNFMRTQPHLLFFPGVMIFISSITFNLMGDRLRDALDPKLKN